MIKIRNLNLNFKNRILFKNFSLDIPLNQLTFITGASGSGKTTLLNVIGGLESTPKETSVLIELKDKFIDLKKEKNIHYIDYVFQDFNLIPELSSLDNIKLGRNILGKKFNKNETIKLFEKFSITEDIYNDRIKNLSGGELQRIAILRALTRDIKILLVDEPSANLDEINTKIVFDLLKEISKEKTVIVVSHDQEVIDKYSDNIITLKNGETEYTKKSFSDTTDVEKYTFKSFSNQVTTQSWFSSFNSKIKISYMLSKNDIRKKWFQFILIIFTIFVSIFTILSMTNFFFGNPRLIGNINVLQYDKVTIKKIKGEVFREDEQRFFSSQNGVENLVTSNSPQLYISTSKNSTNINSIDLTNINYRTIDINDFFRNRILVGNEVEGEFISSPDEVIISQEIVNKLNLVDPIGKSIQIYYRIFNPGIPVVKNVLPTPIETRFERTLKIVGVNKLLDENNNSFSYFAEKSIEQIAEEQNKNTVPNLGLLAYVINPSITNATFLPSLDTNDFTITTVDPEVAMENVTFFTNRFRKLETNMILVSSALLSQINNSFHPLTRISIRTKRQYRPMVLIGSFESNVPEVRMSSETLKLLNKNAPDTLDLYFSSGTNINNVVNRLKSTFRVLEVTNFDDDLRKKVFENTSIFYLVSLITGFLFTLITLLFSLVFSKLLVSSKKKEIGVFKALGAKNTQIYFCHATNILFISIFSYILMIILYYPFYFLISTFADFFANSLPNPNELFLWMFLIWLSLSFIIITLYTLISILTIKKPFKKLMQ